MLPSALVTGAAGFLGSHLVRDLQRQQRVRVVALDDLSGGFRQNLPADVDFVEGSVTDAALVEKLFTRYRFAYVYHLAAYAAEGLSHFIRRFNYTNNVIGSINLINESIKNEVECFVFTSSIAVYGAMQPPMRETDAPRPEDPYGVAKFTVEMDLAAAHHMFGLNYVIFRPHNVYGEFQNLGDPYRNVVGIFMNQILQGKPMTIFGDGSQRRAFSYVRDITPVIAGSPWVAASRQQVFNIGADHPYTVTDLASEVANAMGVPGHPVEHLPARNEVHTAYSDHTRVAEVFGAHAQTSLKDGLRQMAGWARQEGIRSAKPFEGVEVLRNLPPSWARLIASDDKTYHTAQMAGTSGTR